MLQLRLEVSPDKARGAAEALAENAGVRRMVSAPSVGGTESVVVTADVMPAAADHVVAVMERIGAGTESFVLTRGEVVAPVVVGRTASSGGEFAWVEVMGEARAQSRPLGRFIALMAVAGVIAALGVITRNSILIVGAMAVSPDLLPISATCVGIVGRRARLARSAGATLVIGLLLVACVAAVVAVFLDLTAILPSDFRIGGGGLGSLAKTNYVTVMVAAAAGVAAMLSFETRASAAVGVAISVTTIPASAYLGVAVGVGEVSQAKGALLVVPVNVALLIVTGSTTLAAQLRASNRSGHLETSEVTEQG